MKKIFIVLAFIFVGMANAMQWSLLDGNKVRQYVHTDPKEIAYLKGIQDLYKCIQQRESRTQGAVQSEGPTRGPGIEQIFYFLKPVQNHNAEPFERNSYLTEHENDKNEESNPRKRTFEEAVASDEKHRDLSNEPVVSNTSKKVARKRSMLSKKICGINGCSYSSVDCMKRHQKTLHEQKQCPYPGCAFHHQSQGELLQHIKRSHLEKSCPVCGYAPKGQINLRSNLLRHLQNAKHRHVPKNPASTNLGKGKIA